MAKMLGLSIILTTVAQALQWPPSVLVASQHGLNVSLLSDDDGGDCVVPEGRLLFLHVMKAGGTSIDAFLACHCKRVGCSLLLSLGPYQDLHGNKNCEKPAICTTHGNYVDREELCGESFAQPDKVFTAFREPVSRVFSLYNYEKAMNLSLPSITEVYQQCEKEVMNETTPVGWLCDQMTNHLTLKTFASKENLYSSAMNAALMEEAKAVVRNLDAIIFMDDFDHFTDAFRDSSLITNSYLEPQAKRCELGHSNPTDCPSCAEAPTAAEVELIKQHNAMDIVLYDYAATLPNRRGQ